MHVTQRETITWNRKKMHREENYQKDFWKWGEAGGYFGILRSFSYNNLMKLRGFFYKN